MAFARWFISLVLLGAVAGPASAFDAGQISKTSTYQEVKTWHEQFLASKPSLAARTEAFREILRSSRVGERGLRSVYKNFDGRWSIDPRIPGVEQSVLLQRSSNELQAKGYRRELLYAIEFHNDPRFSLREMNRLLVREWGRTDADLSIRHRPTGLYGRVEVKDVSPQSQRTNLAKLKVQADKMALEARKTGQLQFWMNRRPVVPEFQAYASAKGIHVLGSVKTGRIDSGKVMPVEHAFATVDRQMVRANARRAAMGGAGVAFGTWMLAETAPAVWESLKFILDPSTRTAHAWRAFGEQTSYFASGGGMAVGGASMLASTYAREAAQIRLWTLARYGGAVALAGFGLGEMFLISRYMHGDVSSREFWTSQSILAFGAAGGIGGAWLGGVLAAAANPGLSVYGSVVSSAIGAWSGSKLGRLLAERYYDWKYGKLDEAFGEWVYRRYGLSPT